MGLVLVVRKKNNNHTGLPDHAVAEIRRMSDDVYQRQLNSSRQKKEGKLAKLVSHSRPCSGNPPDDSVVNLSSYTLSNAEHAVLCRGLSFCPTKHLDRIPFCADLESFFRRLRLKEYFHTNAHQPADDPDNTASERTKKQPPTKRNDSWTPPEERNAKLDLYINSFRKCVHSQILTKQQKLVYNLTPVQRQSYQQPQEQYQHCNQACRQRRCHRHDGQGRLHHRSSQTAL